MITRGQSILRLTFPYPFLSSQWFSVHKVDLTFLIQYPDMHTPKFSHQPQTTTTTAQPKHLNILQSLSLCSPLKSSQAQSSPLFHSIRIQPQVPNKIAYESPHSKKEIYQQIKSIFQTRRGQKAKEHSSSIKIKLSREQKITLHLPESLKKYCSQHKLREKKQQIQYANTLKRIRAKGKKFGCQIRARSQGIELQMTQEKQKKDKDIFNYTFGKDFDRFFRKKLVKESRKCHKRAVSLNLSVQHNGQGIEDVLKKNENQQKYKLYDFKRIQTYLKAKATNKAQYPFYIKKQLQSKMAKTKVPTQTQNTLKTSPPLLPCEAELASPQSLKSFTLSIDDLKQQRSQSPNSSSRSQRWLIQYHEDIVEFFQICEFFYKIQNQLLKYLPNNHLANKILALINQVENGDVIWMLYKKCKSSMKCVVPSEVVRILRKCNSILATMNYIVNVIKLNISAERKKRFKDTEQSIQKYQKIVRQRHGEVCKGLHNLENLVLKKAIHQSIANTRFQCLALKPVYQHFTEQSEKQEFSELHSAKNRNFICEILTFQKLMK